MDVGAFDFVSSALGEDPGGGENTFAFGESFAVEHDTEKGKDLVSVVSVGNCSNVNHGLAGKWKHGARASMQIDGCLANEGSGTAGHAVFIPRFLRRFHFEDCWAEDAMCGRIVSEVWSVGKSGLMGTYMFQNCLQDCALRLGKWNASKRADIRHCINEKKE
ncbi:hypothetical protein ACOSP7_020805 [Xanthoceras sorbifolium]